MTTHRQQQTSSTATRGSVLVASLVSCCLCIALLLSPATSFAEGSASNRKEAISQALSRSEGNAKVLGVKRIEKNNGAIVFSVKVISNGRVKVIQIPKKASE